MKTDDIVVIKNAGQEIPLSILNSLCEKHNSCGQAAVIEGTLHLHHMKNPTAADVHKVQNAVKDHQLMMIFYTSDKDTLEEDHQPFVLLDQVDDPSKPALVGFIEGNFDKYKKGGTKHTGAFFAAVEKLRPQLAMLWRMADNDMDKLFATLDDPGVKTFIDTLMDGEAGSIVLMEHNIGTTKIWTTREHAEEFEFGWMSNKLGFKEKEFPEKKEEAKPEAKKGFNPLAFAVKKKAEEPAKEVLKAEEVLPDPQKKPVLTAGKPKEQKPILTGSKQTATSVPVVMLDEKVWIEPPPEVCQHPKSQKRWYSKYGPLPKNWRDKPAIQVSKSKLSERDSRLVVKSFQELGQATDVKAAPVQESKKHDPDAERFQKDTTVKEKAIEEKSLRVSEPVPIIGAKGKEYLIDHLIPEVRKEIEKYLDANGKITEHPEDMRKKESKVPGFTAQTGMKDISETYLWSYDRVLRLCKEYPDAAAVLMWAYRNELLNKMVFHTAEGDKPAEVPEKPAQVEQPVTKKNTGYFLPKRKVA